MILRISRRVDFLVWKHQSFNLKVLADDLQNKNIRLYLNIKLKLSLAGSFNTSYLYAYLYTQNQIIKAGNS